MAKTLQNDSAADTVAKLGIKLEDLKKKTPAEQFRALSAAINSVQDPSQKAAISMERTARQRTSSTRSGSCIAAGAANFRAQRRGTPRALFVRWIRLGRDGSRHPSPIAGANDYSRGRREQRQEARDLRHSTHRLPPMARCATSHDRHQRWHLRNWRRHHRGADAIRSPRR